MTWWQTGPCDFVAHVAARVPLTIICQMMGIPGSSYDMVLRDTNIILSGADPDFMSEDPDVAVGQLLTAGQELADLVTELREARLAAPTDDLITALATANIDGEQLTSAELASFFILLVVAGNETTRTAISHALVLLTDNPAQRALLLDDFEARIGGAVEEIVRAASPVMFMRRTLTRDYTMNGHDYRAGDKVALVLLVSQSGRGGVHRPVPVRYHPVAEPACRLRRRRAAFLPRRAPGPAGDQRDASRAAEPGARHPRRRATRPAAVQLHQRDQAPELRLHPLNGPGWPGTGTCDPSRY